MLDLETLRFVQASVAICAFGLVFAGTYRATRAPFAGWWSAALAASGFTSVLLVLGESSYPVASAAVANGLSVVGALFTWMAARSLRHRTLPWWVPVAVGAVTALASLMERPQGSGWPGGLVLLVGMSLFLGLAAMELWKARAASGRHAHERRVDGEKAAALVSMASASSAFSVFYALRAVAYATVGPDSWFYETWAGPLATTYLMTLVLLVVTYSVTTLSHDRLARLWRHRAMTDDLTGLLTRTEFGLRAEFTLTNSPPAARPALIVADLDHFKDINDSFGHAAGDQTLVSFAAAMRKVLGADDVASRFGGEEFVMLIANTDRYGVTTLLDKMNVAFGDAVADQRVLPTASYGVALWERGLGLSELMERADRALYRAKEQGRAQTVIHGAAGDR